MQIHFGLFFLHFSHTMDETGQQQNIWLNVRERSATKHMAAPINGGYVRGWQSDHLVTKENVEFTTVNTLVDKG
jgi:hypothetical protein